MPKEIKKAAPIATTTKILGCKCEHRYQDLRYGVGKRLHNPCRGTGTEKTNYRCTVCGSTKAG